MMKYNSVEECQNDVSNLTNITNIIYATCAAMYNAVAMWLIIVMICISIGLSAGAWAAWGWKVGLVVFMFINSFSFIFCIASKYARKKISEQVISIRANIAMECFEKIEGFDKMEDWEKKQIFTNQICPAAQIVEINYNNADQCK